MFSTALAHRRGFVSASPGPAWYRWGRAPLLSASRAPFARQCAKTTKLSYRSAQTWGASTEAAVSVATEKQAEPFRPPTTGRKTGAGLVWLVTGHYWPSQCTALVNAASVLSHKRGVEKGGFCWTSGTASSLSRPSRRALPKSRWTSVWSPTDHRYHA